MCYIVYASILISSKRSTFGKNVLSTFSWKRCSQHLRDAFFGVFLSGTRFFSEDYFMKKKFAVIFLIIACLLTCIPGLAACGDSNDPVPSHSHIWSNIWQKDNTHHWHNCIDAYCTIADNA